MFERAALVELARRRYNAEWTALLRIEIDRIAEINETLRPRHGRRHAPPRR